VAVDSKSTSVHQIGPPSGSGGLPGFRRSSKAVDDGRCPVTGVAADDAPGGTPLPPRFAKLFFLIDLGNLPRSKIVSALELAANSSRDWVYGPFLEFKI